MIDNGSIKLTLPLKRSAILRPSWEEVGPEGWPPLPYALYESAYYPPSGGLRELHLSLTGDDLPPEIERPLGSLEGIIRIEVIVIPEDEDEPLTEEELRKELRKIT